MKRAKLWIALVLLVLVITLVLQNRAPVSTNFLLFTFTMPRATLLALTMLVGIVIGILISLALAARRNKPETTAGHGEFGRSDAFRSEARQSEVSRSEAIRSDASQSNAGRSETSRGATGSGHRSE